MAAETTPLVVEASDATTRHVSKKAFRFKALTVLLMLLIPSFVALVTLFLSSNTSPLSFWWKLCGWIVFTLVIGYLFLFAHGFNIWQRGPLPPKKDSEAKYIEICGSTNDNGRRIVEYYVWGSTKSAATPLVVLHGSNCTRKYLNQYLFPDEVMNKLNVKVISPSYPGHGGSDPQPYRRITNWPKTDLLPYT